MLGLDAKKHAPNIAPDEALIIKDVFCYSLAFRSELRDLQN